MSVKKKAFIGQIKYSKLKAWRLNKLTTKKYESANIIKRSLRLSIFTLAINK